MKKAVITLLFLTLFLSVLSGQTKAQRLKPIKWDFSYISANRKELQLIFTATLEEGWHVYSQFIEEGGPLPTTFTFNPSNDYSLLERVKEESLPVESYDKNFMMDIVWFSKNAVFSQKVKLHVPATTIKGKIEFMVCTDEMCLPPEDIEFSLKVKVEKPEKKKSESQSRLNVLKGKWN